MWFADIATAKGQIAIGEFSFEAKRFGFRLPQVNVENWVDVFEHLGVSPLGIDSCFLQRTFEYGERKNTLCQGAMYFS